MPIDWAKVEAAPYALGDAATEIALKGQESSALQRQKAQQDEALRKLIGAQEIEKEREKHNLDMEAKRSEREAEWGDQQKRLETIPGLLGKYGRRGVSLSDRGVSVTSEPEGMGGYRDLSNKRLEAKAIDDESHRLLAKLRDQSSALKDIESLMTNPSNITVGSMRVKLAKLSGEVGNLAVQEQEQALPSSLGGEATKLKNWITGGTDSPLTEQQWKSLNAYLATKKQALARQKNEALSELRTRVNSLAPSHSQEERDYIINNMGSTIYTGGGEGDEKMRKLQEISKKIEEMEAKKAASGAR